MVKTNGDDNWKVHPYLLVEIEQISTNLYGTPSSGRYFCKLHNPTSSGTNMNLKIIGGKKIFRRTELTELKQMNINILDSRGNKCMLGYGGSNLNPTIIGTNIEYTNNISMDFKITRLEADLEANNLNIN
jgi:hypothetical protein